MDSSAREADPDAADVRASGTTGARCPNCGTPAPGAYCPSCGQRQEELRKSLLAWLRDALDEVFSLDARLPRTVGALLFRPGRLTRDWIEGRRKRWVGPLRIFLGALLVFFAVVFTTGIDAWLAGGSTDAGQPETVTELVQEDYGATPEELAQREEFRFIVDTLVLVLVPGMAGVLWLLFLGSDRYLVEHVVFALHWVAFALTVLLLGFGAEMLGERLGGTADFVVADVLGSLLVVWLLVYSVLAFRRAYALSWTGTALRTAGGVGLVVLLLLLGGRPLGYALGSAGAWLRARFGEDPLAVQEDRAYDLIRQASEARESGDSARTRTLSLAGIKALYRIADGEEDRHDRYHLVELQLWAGQPCAALATAEQMLERMPEDLRALGIGGRAARACGRDSLATEWYGAYLERYRRLGRDSVVAAEGHPDDVEAFAEEAEAVVAPDTTRSPGDRRESAEPDPGGPAASPTPGPDVTETPIPVRI